MDIHAHSETVGGDLTPGAKLDESLVSKIHVKYAGVVSLG